MMKRIAISGLLSLALSAACAAADAPRFVFELPVTVKLAVGFKGGDEKGMGEAKGTLFVRRGEGKGELVVEKCPAPAAANGGQCRFSVDVDHLMLAQPDLCTPTITAMMWDNDPQAVPIIEGHLGAYHPHLVFRMRAAELKNLAKLANNAWYRKRATRAAADAVLDRMLDPKPKTGPDAAALSDVWARFNGYDLGLTFRDYPLDFVSAPDGGCSYRTDNKFSARTSDKDSDSVVIELDTDALGTLKLER